MSSSPESSHPPFLEVRFAIPTEQSYTYRNLPAPEEEEKKPEPGAAAPPSLIGRRVEVLLGRRKKTGWITGTPSRPPDHVTLKSIVRIIDPAPLFRPDFYETARWMAEFYICSPGIALNSMLPLGRREKNFLTDEPDLSPENKIPSRLSEEQSKALETVLKTRDGFFFLFGITGSGKTEVFLRSALRTIEEGRSVIFLVPEIALTHQTIRVIRTRCSRLAVLHSGLTPSQRLKEWRRILAGEVSLVLGARSAVFAPLENLGLIIIDEEHEGSYKSGKAPRYHSRQVAMYRCKQSKARLLLGSATPSVEAWHLMETGKLTKLTLGKRLSGGSPPRISLVNMQKETGLLSEELKENMRETLREERQVILFLNHRGFAYFLHCRSCRHEFQCRHCSTGLTYYKNRNLLLCHYCGYQTPPPRICPQCRSVEIGASGFGTEQAEEEILKHFPGRPLSRLDRDRVQNPAVLKSELEKFKTGRTQILLGTQMVAKGLNFPGVKLVGILMADMGLNLPDFRAAEKTFGLILQVAGRAGRFRPDGRVILQTFRPEHPLILRAAEGRQSDFYQEELRLRRTLGFPPFSRLFRLVLRGKQKAPLEKTARTLHDLLARRLRPSEILGPGECPLSRIAENHRLQIMIKTRRFSMVHHCLSGILRHWSPPSRVFLEVDIDPVNLL